MNKILVVAVVLLMTTQVCGQTSRIYNIDSLKQILQTDLADTSRIWTLNNLGRNIADSDTTLILADQAIALARRIGFVKGEAEAYNNIAYWFNQKGNYAHALENYLHAIRLSERVNFEAGLKRSYNSISTVYLYLKDYVTSINYGKKARTLSLKLSDPETQSLAASWLSKSFLELGRTDSALKYAHESYDVAMRLKDPMPLYFSTARLGEIHAALGKYMLALEYLRLSLHYSKLDGRDFRISAAHQQLATTFRSVNAEDSCIWHAKQAFVLSKESNLAATLLSSSLLLSELYQNDDASQSAQFLRSALAAQDTLFNQEKNRQIEALNLAETRRQEELEAAQQQAVEARRNNLQYAAIFVGMVAFLIVFLLLSHSVLANPRIIRFLGVLALLFVFEFANLLLHPLLGSLTHHSPLMMLAMMVCIAAILIPLHHYLEKSITEKMIAKNNRIRLSAAKKIIESVEGLQNREMETTQAPKSE